MNNIEKYVIARWAYSVGKPIMSDAEYNLLDQAMKEKFPENPYCQRSWSSDPCPAKLLREQGYEDLIYEVVLTDKTESIPSLNTKLDVQTAFQYMATPHVVSFKLDGWNIQASYYNGELVNIQTRGRSSDAMNANVLSPLVPNQIPLEGKVLITMECTIPDNQFQWFKSTYHVTSQRAAVSTAIANAGGCLDRIALHAHDIRCEKHLDDKLGFLASLGFKVPMHTTVYSYKELLNQIEAYSNYKESYGFPTDGLVVAGDSVRAIRIGAWEEPIYQSYVTGYKETYGPHSIAVQCQIYPIQLPNSVQQQLPATNLSRIISLNLKPGAPIAFRIASSAIADIDESSTIVLQKQWAGREVDYRRRVEINEMLK